jgi:hypothetical protein
MDACSAEGGRDTGPELCYVCVCVCVVFCFWLLFGLVVQCRWATGPLKIIEFAIVRLSLPIEMFS